MANMKDGIDKMVQDAESDNGGYKSKRHYEGANRILRSMFNIRVKEQQDGGKIYDKYNKDDKYPLTDNLRKNSHKFQKKMNSHFKNLTNLRNAAKDDKEDK